MRWLAFFLFAMMNMCVKDPQKQPAENALNPIELEAQILRQEHRTLFILWNWLTRKSTYPDVNDPRRKAVNHAAIFGMFSTRTAVAGGGIAALLSVWLLWEQNRLLQESLFPETSLRVMLGHLVRSSNEEHPILNPDIGIEGRKFEMAFFSSGGPFLIDVVNLKVAYVSADEKLIRTDYFVSKKRTIFPKLDKSDISRADLVFDREASVVAPVDHWKKPVKVKCEFSVTAIDAQTKVWFGLLEPTIKLMDDNIAPERADASFDLDSTELSVKLRRIN